MKYCMYKKEKIHTLMLNCHKDIIQGLNHYLWPTTGIAKLCITTSYLLFLFNLFPGETPKTHTYLLFVHKILLAYTYKTLMRMDRFIFAKSLSARKFLYQGYKK